MLRLVRAVAQPGSASAWGAEGRGFESRQPDHLKYPNSSYSQSTLEYRVKLIQLNIWGGNLIRNAVRYFEKEQPDILCLQEVASSPDAEVSMWTTLEDIQQKFNYPYVFFTPIFDSEVMGKTVYFGNAILSRVPFVFQHDFYVNLEYKKNWKTYEDDYNIRNVQHVVIQNNDRKINIINHHGYHISSTKLGNEETDRQIGLIEAYIDTLNGPVIFTGDLNLAPESKSLDGLNTKLDNLCLSTNVETTRNFTAKREIEICDYIFVSKDVDVQSFHVPKDVVSDHQPLVLEFK